MPLSPFGLLDRWLAPAPAQRRIAWLGEQPYAHRGLHDGMWDGPVLENALPAFTAAIAAGHGIECDVQRSGDGQAVVFHDWDLERLTGQAGAVGDFSAAQLGKIGLTGGEDTIPTLAGTLAQVHGQVPILIEVKSRRDRRVHALCLAVRRVLEGYRGPHAVMSFDPRVSRWFARYSPHTVRGLVVTEENARTLSGRGRRYLALWHARPDFLAYDIRDLPSSFPEAQRKRGLPVLTWTVRSPELAARAAQYADAPIAEGGGLG